MGIVRMVLAFLRALMAGRTELAAENLALLHHRDLAIAERLQHHRPPGSHADHTCQTQGQAR